jgi:hypothetical protein
MGTLMSAPYIDIGERCKQNIATGSVIFDTLRPYHITTHKKIIKCFIYVKPTARDLFFSSDMLLMHSERLLL